MVLCSLQEQTLWHIETENRSRPTTDSSSSERWTHVRPALGLCQGQMCLESCVFCGLLLWKHLSPSRISGQRMEKTPVMFLRYIFRRHIVTFSHFIGLLSAKTIYLLGFMMETLANMFFALTINQNLGTAMRFFLNPKLPFRTSVDIRVVTHWV